MTSGVMLAVILWLVLGWRAATAELLAEILIGLTLYGGGGHRRIRRTFHFFALRAARLRPPEPVPGAA